MTGFFIFAGNLSRGFGQVTWRLDAPFKRPSNALHTPFERPPTTDPKPRSFLDTHSGRGFGQVVLDMGAPPTSMPLVVAAITCPISCWLVFCLDAAPR